MTRKTDEMGGFLEFVAHILACVRQQVTGGLYRLKFNWRGSQQFPGSLYKHATLLPFPAGTNLASFVQFLCERTQHQIPQPAQLKIEDHNKRSLHRPIIRHDVITLVNMRVG